MATIENPSAIVRVVADGLLAREPAESVIAKLRDAGVPEAEAPRLYGAIREACQQGVQCALTGGHSSPDGPPADPILAEAFRVGQASFRGAVSGVWVKRFIGLALLAGLVGLVVWLVSR